MSMTGLDRIVNRILDDARSEANRILTDAEQENANIREEYTARAEQIRETLSNEAERDALEMISRAKSSAATQKRNFILQRKSDLVDEVFADAMESVKRMSNEKYTSLMVGLLTACFLKQLEAERACLDLYGEEETAEPEVYEVVMNPRDRDRCGAAVMEGVKKKLHEKATEQKLSKLMLAKTTAPIDGGFILRCGDIETNCTLSLLFAQLREELETEVGQALFVSQKQA